MSTTPSEGICHQKDDMRKVVMRNSSEHPGRRVHTTTMPFVPARTVRAKYRYFRSGRRSVLRKTNLNLDDDDYAIQTDFTLSDVEKRAWRNLFAVAPPFDIPLPYELPAMLPPATRLVTSLGVNLRFLRHVRTLVTYDTGRPPLRAGDGYTVRTWVGDVTVLGSNSILVVLHSEVLDDDGATRVAHQAHFMIDKVGERNMARLRADPARNKTDLGSLDLTRYTKETLDMKVETTSTFVVPPRMGIRFARLSGDYNVHIYRVAARLFGFRKPFIQGNATAAYAVRYISEISAEAMKFLDIVFIRPVFVGEEVEFQSAARRFRMSDSRGRVLAHGTWR
ncbi:MaoC family dehydratase [Actinoplanes sp. TBRC 11911]|uniref:MaoC family dehydratase n=1 Tax=Actinoplanes sp. TBRC 11911 TaxID=2729386 RepID=UPI00145DA15E|nr:MaoC family dehydratase [Actinoplanes sp. TBRC 11911]NMO51950.1 MaoC family dehydratase [Actinoplanes sp. TBRC 11911]